MFNSENDIIHIGHGLMDLTLPKSEWTHAAHFAAACWLFSHPDIDAFAQMPDNIRNYNSATGVVNSKTEGYHETITIASLRITAAFLEGLPVGLPLYVKVNSLLKSELGRSDWLLTYWSKALLFSPKARQEWVGPDLQALPI